MTLAAILAGGSGARFGDSALPKQFLDLGGRPVLARTAEKFLTHPGVAFVIVLCPGAWLSHTQSILAAAFGADARVAVIEGGESRNDTLRRALEYIDLRFGREDDHILLTHDAVRPFVTHRMIGGNIEAAAKYGACDTAIPATDTIVESADGRFISAIPERGRIFHGQTPQSFRVNKLRALMESLSAEEEALLTDACKIFALRGEPVALVAGEPRNIKITYAEDLKVAEALIDR